MPIIDGLKQMHAEGYLHRDIKPSNIYVRRADESPVLLGFGAARQALGRKSKTHTAVASAGYSPPEQYESEGEQGAWTDIYALSALCYRAITGKRPIESIHRQSQLLRGRTDPLPSLAKTFVDSGYTEPLLRAVELGLRIIETERPPSLDEWVSVWSQASTDSSAKRAAREAPGSRNWVERDQRVDTGSVPAPLPKNRRWTPVKAGAVRALTVSIGYFAVVGLAISEVATQRQEPFLVELIEIFVLSLALGTITFGLTTATFWLLALTKFFDRRKGWLTWLMAAGVFSGWATGYNASDGDVAYAGVIAVGTALFAFVFFGGLMVVLGALWRGLRGLF